MGKALIGWTGFVGTTLLKQCAFDSLYRSTNINEIVGRSFDMVICAGAPAQKWIANQNPIEDLQKVEALISNLKTISCKMFILISTVDVFKNANGVDENTLVDESGLHPYGSNRRLLEKFVQTHFPGHLIVRLPGLVGPNLRKNVIFDFLNHNNLDAIESRNIFQFYPMVNLWYDIQTALNANLKLIHLTSEPISVSEVSKYGFGKVFDQAKLGATPIRYDMRSCYANIFGSTGNYQYTSRETLLAIRAYAQSEPPTSHLKG